MENEESRKPSFIRFIRYYFYLRRDKENELETIANIRSGVEFKGANLWILIFAILIASLGLNINSAAVVIGAMLISPLMGPLIGMGLALGINDLELLKKSLRSYAVATVISIITAALFFVLSPFDQPQSELLARTSPTIYDVFIALMGGLAGFIALSTKDKGNVIPGVAIATALMPPLCTAGFGIATGSMRFFLGAFYLYFINTVFIVSATFLGTRIRGYEHKVFREKKREQAVKRSILAIVIITMIPALMLTIDIVRSSLYENEANQYIDKAFVFPDSQIISRNISYKNKTIDIMLIGREVPEDALSVARSQMNRFQRLENSRLTVVQGGKERVDLDAIRSSVLEDFYQKSEERINAQQELIDTLSTSLDRYRYFEALSSELIGELNVLYPTARELSISQAINVSMEDQEKDTLTIAVIKFDSIPPAEQLQVMSEWLKTRIDTKKLRLIAE
ncbi:MAG: TIGR00341 family protein [Bacteroidales bacterium]|nr:TIGR00341 family protein [Bacteroidales bacterium]MDD2770640.1 TIGR00341 family protein [Bacteroidales bacterium]MDD4064718.1 TIGR00341 family protein [Bacteroidales bacterium]MDD4499044.1 TIGR00341 family protein [Bacteroidales bacterium]MDD5283018.1 TIGR00341 family protein [Bacteroidales bacterium]